MKFGWGKGLFDKPNDTIKLEDTYFEKLVDTEKVWKIFNSVLNSSFCEYHTLSAQRYS